MTDLLKNGCCEECARREFRVREAPGGGIVVNIPAGHIKCAKAWGSLLRSLGVQVPGIDNVRAPGMVRP